MATVVEIAGFQYEVEKDSKLSVPLLEGNPGDSVEFSNVLLNEKDGNFTFGSPLIDGAKVTGKILEHKRDSKILIFHKKRRKGYQKLNGHRQHYTRIQITDISV
ncbi:MAG: 50S ribosomal protein L21 [Candidatus Kapaibacterium sp.]